MNLTETILKKLVPTGKDLGRFVDPLNETMERYEIGKTLNRAAMFLAQLIHESGGFVYMREIASGKAYEGRKDLGNTIAGDGVKYKGRGAIQITGRNNYTRLSEDFGVDFVNEPTLLEQPNYAIQSAGWFWNGIKGNEIADLPHSWRSTSRKYTPFEYLTYRVNGGQNGIAHRKEILARALKILAPLFTENVLSWRPGENIG